MKKNFVIMCFVSLLPLLANAQFETINDVRYYYTLIPQHFSLTFFISA